MSGSRSRAHTPRQDTYDFRMGEVTNYPRRDQKTESRERFWVSPEVWVQVGVHSSTSSRSRGPHYPRTSSRGLDGVPFGVYRGIYCVKREEPNVYGRGGTQECPSGETHTDTDTGLEDKNIPVVNPTYSRVGLPEQMELVKKFPGWRFMSVYDSIPPNPEVVSV